MLIYKSIDFWKKESEPQVSVNYHKSNVPLLMHCHDFLEIAFIIDGKGYHTIDKKQYLLEPNTVILVEPYVTHSMSFSGDIRYYDLLIGKNVLSMLGYQNVAEEIRKYIPAEKDETALSPVTRFDEQEFAQFINMLKLIQLELQRKKGHYMEVILKQIETCFILTSRAMRSQPGEMDVNTEECMQNMLVYITNHYNQNISLELLSRRYGYATAYISRYFKKQYGKNYYRFLTELRIANAIDLLKSTTYSVEKVAAMVGYQSRSQFCKNFKAVKGRTVSEYMKRRTDVIREALQTAPQPEAEGRPRGVAPNPTQETF